MSGRIYLLVLILPRASRAHVNICTYRAHARVHITHTQRNDLNYTDSRACKSIHVHRAYRVYRTNWGELLVRFRKKGSRRFRADVTGTNDPIVPLRIKIPETGCESSKRIARYNRIVYAHNIRASHSDKYYLIFKFDSIYLFFINIDAIITEMKDVNRSTYICANREMAINIYCKSTKFGSPSFQEYEYLRRI